MQTSGKWSRVESRHSTYSVAQLVHFHTQHEASIVKCTTVTLPLSSLPLSLHRTCPTRWRRKRGSTIMDRHKHCTRNYVGLYAAILNRKMSRCVIPSSLSTSRCNLLAVRSDSDALTSTFMAKTTTLKLSAQLKIKQFRNCF